MNFKSWKSYWEYSREVKCQNRYIYSDDTEKFLANVVCSSESRIREIPAGSVFWRSQMGNDWRPVIQDGERITDEPVPLPPKMMKPVPQMVSEGRTNPKGIPCLYLATDKQTAMSEVRPWMGSYVSVGEFKTLSNLRIIDCSIHHSKQPLFFIRTPSEEEIAQAVWAHIDHAFSEPVSASDMAVDYAPTQILAELFRGEGYDGVWYKSALSDGFNLALFNIDSATLVSCQLYEVKRIQYSFSESSNPYYIKS